MLKIDDSLFPKSEQWGSGDEAIDNKLSVALKNAIEDLTLESVSRFYFSTITLNPRVFNPSFHMTLELVTKALLFSFSPESFNDHLWKKLKGHYYDKEKVHFEINEVEKIISELIGHGYYRYKGGLVDFYLTSQEESTRNPFVKRQLINSAKNLQIKIIKKDLRLYLSGDNDRYECDDHFLNSLKIGKTILSVKNLGEIWYDEDQIYSLSSL